MLTNTRKASRRIALIVSAVCAVGAAPSKAAPIVTSHGTLAAPATGLALGTDGALWHTSRGKPPRIGRTNLAGRTVEVALGEQARPGAIIVGPDKAMWIADERGAILRFGADAPAQTVRELGDATPTALAEGPDGNLWVALAAEDAEDRGIGRLTPEGVLTVFGAGDLPGSPGEIAVGWDGALWFTMPSADRIGRVTTAGAVTDFPAAAPLAIAAGPDGGMWFTAGRDGIGRIGTDGHVSMFTDGLTPADRPGDIALGADGALWFTLHKEIGRINVAGAVTRYPVGDRRPGAIVAGWDRAMWFTDTKSKALGRIGAAAAARSTPLLGETFVGSEKRGQVRVRTPGSRKSVPLPASATLPFGAVVDATDGALKVRTAVPGGGTQTGTFFGGRFKVLQRRKGMVRIALRGRIDCGGERGTTATVSRRRKKRRRVWGSDFGGLFETLGLNSITTVRGTRWLTEDRCNGTLTRVTEGSVVVRDRGTRKRTVVKAGQRYFARER